MVLSSGEELFVLHCKAYKLTPEREYRFDKMRRWKADFFFAPNLLVEIEGGTGINGRHNRAKGYSDDCCKYNQATEMGFRILRFTSEMVVNGTAIDTTLRVLAGK